jgi:hypothetical protein
MKLAPGDPRRANTLTTPCLLFLKLYSVKSGNTRLSVANCDDKSNGYFACLSAFWQAAARPFKSLSPRGR